MRWLVSALCREDHPNYSSVYNLTCWKLPLKPETWCTCSIYPLCSSCGCSIHESWWFPKKWLPLPVHRPSGIQPANVCSNVPFKNGITLDWTMEESPATCSTLQFTTQFHDHVPMNWFSIIRFISISLCSVNCLVVVFWFCGEGPYLIQPQISCWPALQLDEDRFGIWFEHSAKAVRAQIDACAKWLTAASVFCAWYFDIFW